MFKDVLKKILLFCCAVMFLAACGPSGSGAETDDHNDTSMPRNGSTGPGNTMTDTESIFNDTGKNSLKDTNTYDNMSNRVKPDGSQ